MKLIISIIVLSILLMACTKPPSKEGVNVCEIFAHQCDCPCQPVPRPQLTPDEKKLMDWYNKKKGE